MRLVSEVIASQNGSCEESDSMDLSSVDFSLKTVEKCKHTNYVYALSRLIPSTCDITDLSNALKLLKKEKLCLYRLKN